MARGAAVIRRPGKRGVAWAIKYRDSSGRQLWETLGREPAWNEAKAQRELGVRLAAVERERYRKPQRVTFAEFAERWEREYLPGRNLKPSTESDYLSILRGRLLPYFGAYELASGPRR
jgi:Phage integrase, N-terminal SAM-like domain